ncbi:unnamed protein product [Albugo candida]|uniref:Serine/threonine-protein phosphatase n=1 Tax=Albugo candida TaxID=65357 RepID=A0A024GQF2_9STRA|nr:unnamed protein product [Albugo candida]|eukprot:CCI49006.1 unnamed protein product [Albugo candida]
MHVAKQLERLQRGELLDCATFLALCDRVKDIMVQDDNIVHISSPVTICGDIHGQFYDLLELFKLSDAVPSTHYIFLGDFVDRGAMSVETIALLCIFKVLYPSAVTLLRGNHESRQTTAVYGFQMECLKKYDGDPRPYKACMDMFDFLPLGALVDQHLFCLHGGLSPAIHHLDQLRMIHRFMEIPADGPFADIVWSDPDPKNTGFHLSPRGAGYIFGGDIVEKFLHMNGLRHMSRAHQLCMEGYQVLFRATFSTVWSAPNYCHRFGNLAAVMKVDENLQRSYKVFKEANRSQSVDVQGSASSSADVIDAGYFT